MSIVDLTLKTLAPSPPRHLQAFVLPGATILDGLLTLRERLEKAAEE